MLPGQRPEALTNLKYHGHAHENCIKHMVLDHMRKRMGVHDDTCQCPKLGEESGV